MKKNVIYDWVIDLLEDDEYLEQCKHFRTLKEALDYASNEIDNLSPTEYHELSLSRVVCKDGDENNAIEQIGYALVKDNKLPEVFDTGHKVRRKHKEELDRHKNDILVLMLKGGKLNKN